MSGGSAQSRVGRLQPQRPSIRRLPPSAALGVAAGYSVHGFAHAIEQLCANSIDAGAGDVSVAFDAQRLTAVVSDDGAGIPAASFPLLGVRHCSSKGGGGGDAFGGSGHVAVPGSTAAHGGRTFGAEDDSTIGGGGGSGGRMLGFRGVFLASLAEVAQVEVVSKAAGAFETHRKVLGCGRLPRSGLALRPRAVRGTEVTVTDFLRLQPVRLKALTQQRYSASLSTPSIRMLASAMLLHTPADGLASGF